MSGIISNSTLQAQLDAEPTLAGQIAFINAALTGGQIKFKRGTTVLASGSLVNPPVIASGIQSGTLKWGTVTMAAAATISSATDTVEVVDSGGTVVLSGWKLYGKSETPPNPDVQAYIQVDRDFKVSGKIAPSTKFGAVAIKLSGVQTSSLWGSLSVPLATDFELRQPVPAVSVTVAEVPSSGTLRWMNGATETTLTVGQVLTPAQFKTLKYRPPVSAVAGSAGNFGYMVGSTPNTLRISKIAPMTMSGVQKVRFRYRPGGVTAWEDTKDIDQVYVDPLARCVDGPFPSSVEGIGYQYRTLTQTFTVTGTGGPKDGFQFIVERWLTPKKGYIEGRIKTFPNAAGKWPLRTDADPWSPAADVRQIADMEVDFLDAAGNVYSVAGENSGMVRDHGGARITLTAGTCRWWRNKDPEIMNWQANPRLLYAHRFDNTLPEVGIYSQTNAAGGSRSYHLDPKFGTTKAAAHFGYMGSGDGGTLVLDTGQGGPSHDRMAYHDAYIQLLTWGPSTARPYTVNGAYTYGEIMLAVADCAANNIPCYHHSEPNGGPFDHTRYPAGEKNRFIARAGGDGTMGYYSPSSTGGISPFPTSGGMDLQYGATANGFKVDQAHLWVCTEVPYALTGLMAYFFPLQFGPITSKLTISPGYRDGIVLGPLSSISDNMEPFYRSWIKPNWEGFKGALFSPDYEDGQWLSKQRLLDVWQQEWTNADAYYAEEETSTNPQLRSAWNLGIRRNQFAAPPAGFAGEGVGASGYEDAQYSWLGKPAGSVIFGDQAAVWDVCYAIPMMLTAKKVGLYSSALHDRFLIKLARFVYGTATDCRQGAERTPLVLIDKVTCPPGSGGAPFDYSAYNTSAFNSPAVPSETVNALNSAWPVRLGSAAGPNEYTNWAQVRARRGEPDDAATARYSQNGQANFARYHYFMTAEAIAREFTSIYTRSEFAASGAAGLAYHRRNMGYLKSASIAAKAIWNTSKYPFEKIYSTSLATGDPNVNALQGPLFMQPGHLIISLAPSGSSPKVWQPSGVDA